MKLKKSILAWVMAVALIFFNVPITTVSAADNNLTIQVGETTTFAEGTNIKASKSLPSQQYYYLSEDYNSVAQYNEVRGNSYQGYVLPTYAQLSNEYKAALQTSGYIVPDSGMITWVVERKENRTVAEETIGMDGPETYYRDFPVYKIYPLISYDITIDSNIENGTIAADTTKTTRGNTVTLNITPNYGYEFESVSVKDAKNNDLVVSDTGSARTFTMPAYNVQVSGTFSKIPPTVDTITVAPMAITMHKGDTENFTATVSGTYDPNTAVTWTVEGANSANTTISGSGQLKVGSDETALNLIVKATSVQDATKSSVANVAVIRANLVQSTESNKISGIAEGASYIVGTDITFDATGNSMDNTSPISGDIRYVPVSWNVNPNGTWTSAPYTATFKINNVGNYTLKVVYQKQNYDGTSWADIVGDTDTKAVSFTIKNLISIDSVLVSPTSTTVQKGKTQSFTATVIGAHVPSQNVTWTVEGANSSNTTISGSGELMVGSDETSSKLTVKATSVEDSTKSSTATVTIVRDNIIQSDTSNKITGINEGASYTVGTDITFDATGNSMDNTSPISGDIRYVPVSWSVNPNGTWTSAPYTATFKINNVGNYTLKVVYQEQNYNGSEWVDVAGATDIKTTSFTITSDNNNSNVSDKNNNSNNNTNSTNDNNAIKTDNNSNKADDSLDDVPNTGEDKSLVWLFIVSLMSGTAAVFINSKKLLLGKKR